jgi:hypothetical protein
MILEEDFVAYFIHSINYLFCGKGRGILPPPPQKKRYPKYHCVTMV